MSTPRSRSSRTLFLLGLSALFLGLIAPIAPAVAAEDFSTGPQVWINDDTPTVGDELSAILGVASVPAADTYAYQWYTVDGADPAAPIPGATGEKYTVTSSDGGFKLRVRVTASKAGFNDASYLSVRTETVKYAFDFTSGPQVSIDDTTPTFGQKVSAVVDTDSVPVGTYSYQWYVEHPWYPDLPISGATDASYVIDSRVGYPLKVVVTAGKTGYNDASGTSAATAPIAKADFTADPVPTVSDTTPTVGLPLSVKTTPSSPASDWYDYQWKAGGVAVAGETTDTFTPTSAEAGKSITVSVKAIKYGYNDGTEVTSAPTAAVAAGTFSSSPTPTLSTTTPKVGDVVKVSATGEQPAAGSYSYQWYRISTLGVKSAIPGAIGDSYTVVYNDLTKRIQAQVTAAKPGYTSVSALSVQTAQVNYIALNKTSVTRGQTLGVTAKRLRAGQAYRIYIDGVSVYKGTASSDGSAIRTVGVSTSIGTGTRRVWVSGYNNSGARDFQVITTVIVK